ncbi:MAG: hypothetical protein ACJZ12_04430 [Candidatus Neomarinimicrobiota bacterium]
MLNFQIRGYGMILNAGILSNKKMSLLLNKIKLEKRSLAQIMYEEEWKNHTDIYSRTLPIISEQAELIVTSFNPKNYYEDGYSFYRSKINEHTQIPEELPIKPTKENALIVNKSIYFGCSFEAQLNTLDHKYFNKDYLSISTLTTPLYQNYLVNEIFFNNLKLNNLKRNKYELVQFCSNIYTNSKINKTTNLDSFSSIYPFSKFLESKIKFKEET